MKIIKIISSLSYGGAETQVMNLSRALANAGHEVHLISISTHAPRSRELEGSAVNLHLLGKKRKIDLSAIRRLRRFITALNPDLVHAYLYDAEFYARMALLSTPYSLINSERNDNYKLNLSQRLGNLLFPRRVDGIIANSYAGLQHAVPRYPHLNAENQHVVYNGIDLVKVDLATAAKTKNYRQEFFGETDIKLAVMVASIKPQKNYEMALRIADELVEKDSNWRVAFLGGQLYDAKDNYSADIAKAYEQLQNKSSIMFVGNRNDVLDILACADVNFLCSHHEGFPNAVLEAMACSTPSVTTVFSDIRRIAVDPALLVENHDPVQFAKAVEAAYLNRIELGEKSRHWVEQNCTSPVAAESLVKIYNTYQHNAATAQYGN